MEFIVNRIKDVCKKNKINPRIYFKAKEEGYYAVHIYIYKRYEIPKPQWDTRMWDTVYMTLPVEIQITTQIQEVIKHLLHKQYEEQRVALDKGNNKWQWDYKSLQFNQNYLGHILHYVEGMIMEVRDKQRVDINER